MMEAGDVRRQSPKRQLSELEEISHSKRQRRSYHHHHALHHKPQPSPLKEPAILEPDVLDKFLIEAVKNVLEEEGLKQNISDPLIESLALESLRNAVDECRWPKTYLTM